MVAQGACPCAMCLARFAPSIGCRDRPDAIARIHDPVGPETDLVTCQNVSVMHSVLGPPSHLHGIMGWIANTSRTCCVYDLLESDSSSLGNEQAEGHCLS